MPSEHAKEKRIKAMLFKALGEPDLFSDVSPDDLISSLLNQYPWLKVTLERAEPTADYETEDVETRMSSLEHIMEKVSSDLEFVKAHLKTTDVGNEPCERFVKMVSNIPDVRTVYCRKVPDGFDFWTLFESPDRIKSLREIVTAQTELDKIFKEIYFDFMIDHIEDVDKEELDDWDKIFEK